MTRVDVDWHGDAITEAVTAAAGEGLLAAAEIIGEESDRTAPLDEGTLIRSRTVGLLDRLRAYISYGGAAGAYVVVQHERTDFRHAPGRRAKFLALALVEHGPRVFAALATRIREVLR